MLFMFGLACLAYVVTCAVLILAGATPTDAADMLSHPLTVLITGSVALAHKVVDKVERREDLS